MDREEILKRSRAEKEDEGSTFAENRGRPAEPGRLCAAGGAALLNLAAYVQRVL